MHKKIMEAAAPYLEELKKICPDRAQSIFSGFLMRCAIAAANTRSAAPLEALYGFVAAMECLGVSSDKARRESLFDAIMHAAEDEREEADGCE